MATVATHRIEAAGLSDVGRRRSNNEDQMGFDEEAGIFAVCDGMGGMAAGEVASSRTVEVLLKTFREVGADPLPLEQRLQRAIVAANDAVWTMAQQDAALSGMGTTLVAACTHGSTLLIANVGDSRAYFLRGNACVQVTEDHSCVAEHEKRGGAGAVPASMRQMITRAMGVESSVRADYYVAELEPGDRVLLATDGLTRYMDAAELARRIPLDGDLHLCCKQLIAAAYEQGGEDNVTCLLLRFR
jgi:serine/threonine protein phosphatase PrpC